MDAAEEFGTDNKDMLQRIEIKGLVKCRIGNWKRDIEQAPTFIIPFHKIDGFITMIIFKNENLRKGKGVRRRNVLFWVYG